MNKGITGLSIGIAEFEEEENPEEIVEKADKKMYEEKRDKETRSG